MIIVNGHKFAENEKEFQDSLFTEKTCYGYAKIRKRSIDFYDMRKTIIGCFNCHAVFCSGTPLENGKAWWTYGNPPFLEEYNDAVNNGRYREWRGIVEKFISDYAKGRDHRGYYFK